MSSIWDNEIRWGIDETMRVFINWVILPGKFSALYPVYGNAKVNYVFNGYKGVYIPNIHQPDKILSRK